MHVLTGTIWGLSIWKIESLPHTIHKTQFPMEDIKVKRTLKLLEENIK